MEMIWHSLFILFILYFPVRGSEEKYASTQAIKDDNPTLNTVKHDTTLESIFNSVFEKSSGNNGQTDPVIPYSPLSPMARDPIEAIVCSYYGPNNDHMKAMVDTVKCFFAHMDRKAFAPYTQDDEVFKTIIDLIQTGSIKTTEKLKLQAIYICHSKLIHDKTVFFVEKCIEYAMGNVYTEWKIVSSKTYTSPPYEETYIRLLSPRRHLAVYIANYLRSMDIDITSDNIIALVSRARKSKRIRSDEHHHLRYIKCKIQDLIREQVECCLDLQFGLPQKRHTRALVKALRNEIFDRTEYFPLAKTIVHIALDTQNAMTVSPEACNDVYKMIILELMSVHSVHMLSVASRALDRFVRSCENTSVQSLEFLYDVLKEHFKNAKKNNLILNNYYSILASGENKV